MEDIIFTTQILTQFDLEQKNNHKVRAIVICQEKMQNVYQFDLMGKEVKQYVYDVLSDFETTTVVLKDEKKTLVEVVAPYVKDEDYVLVLYADTPFLTKNTIVDALEYATTKSLDFCKLYRGAILKASAVKQNKIEYMSEANFLDKNDFFCIFDNKTICQARRIMNKRNIEKLVKNGVEIFDVDNLYVDSDVEIESGVKIYSNNVIKGHTKIGKQCVLLENNVLNNCELEQNCEIKCCYLENVKIKKNEKIGPFEKRIKEKK